jgi:hypothetical protein
MKWGIDFIGPISPVSSQKKRYIILATDYATKWVEARATQKNDAQTSASFLFEEVMMTERANGIVGKILNKMVSAHKTSVVYRDYVTVT